ncbi:MAG TPA: protein translocase subunit SecD [Ornithinimicrobium sp.]|uniref:protein translocase subunit SecD n=1 Tax=Ornithinimicrobium sp. TaxID=1977084 RepID=UPI002B46C95C|nr:protein translocase subunit SecD [Ornithinimicrobium sp.]HKJ11785.1 protein translocase subunit SecD [Ornithinimicrobium sp.]
MALKPRNRKPARTLGALVALIVLLFGGLVAATQWADPRAQLTPLLGLDLAGGRQIVIEPVVSGSSEASEEQVQQAIDIIRRRIDGSGTAEAEVSRLGGDNIAVAIPGNPSAAQLEALSRSSQLQFRPVLVAQPVGADAEQPTEQPVLPLPDSFQPEPSVEGQEGSPDAPTTEEGPDDAETSNGPFPEGLRAQDDADRTEDVPGLPEDGVAPEPSDASDLAQITPELEEEFLALNCAENTEGERVAAAAEDEPVVACATDASEKYILGPVELTGAAVQDATAGLEQGQGGSTTGRVQVALDLDSQGGDKFAEITARLFQYPQGQAQNRFAIVLDGSAITAPGINEPISGGQASITGDFTMETAEILANQIKFGALPISFDTLTSEQISPTLGGEQLRMGIIAGVVGLMLVFGYSLAQYRALGLVTIGSLAVAAVLAYLAVSLLGWAANFRLTMAGVTGLIVAIGITADSFIVYFERIRDEVRAGRPLRYAVDTGWARARRTILISDAVNLIAAGVLFWLSESSVKAFAFTLGLITVIDLMVIFMFTHPVVSMLANTRFFGEGHRWSGMDPERLGAKRSTYLGRGRVNLPPVKTKPSRAEIEGGVV